MIWNKKCSDVAMEAGQRKHSRAARLLAEGNLLVCVCVCSGSSESQPHCYHLTPSCPPALAPPAAPPSRSAVLEALEQRQAKYVDAANQAKASGDNRKARMHDRISKVTAGPPNLRAPLLRSCCRGDADRTLKTGTSKRLRASVLIMQ